MTGLTDAEREVLAYASSGTFAFASLVAAVERILAERDAAWVAKIEALADERDGWASSTFLSDAGFARHLRQTADALRALLSADGT